MANGTISFVTQGNLMGQIVWEAVSNGTAANTSTVTCTIQARKTSNTTEPTYGTWSGTLIIGGKTENFSGYATVGSNSWVTLKSFSATISHNINGAGSCRIYGKISGPSGTTLAGRTVSGSETVTLDTIPRQAVLTSVTDFFDTENPVITYTNPLGAAVPSLQAGISLTGTSDCEITYRDVDKTAGKDTLELTEAERDVLRAATTDKNYRTLWIYLRTRIGETYYYSPNSLRFTIFDPKPDINPTITDTNTKTTDLTGDSSKLIRYFSNAAITIGASAVKQASITSQKVACGSKSLTANGTINAVESNRFVFTAKDNRGNTTTITKTLTMVEYIRLTCSQENTQPNVNGEITIKVKGAFFNGSFGAQTNTVAVTVVYKESGGAYGNPVTMSVTPNGQKYEATAKITGLNPEKTYIFKATATDLLSSVSSNERPVKLMPVFDWSGNDFCFNVPVFDRFRTSFYTGLAAYTNADGGKFDPDITIEPLILTNVNTPVSGQFMYISTVFYSHKSATANRAQIAVPYKSGANNMFHRYYFSGAWSAWEKLLNVSDILDMVYPVGSYYISHTSTSPASLFGGTWHRIESRFLWAAPATSELGKTAGEQTHTLTNNELPKNMGKFAAMRWPEALEEGIVTATQKETNTAYSKGTSYGSGLYTLSGGGAAHNNMPPYVTVAIWRRTA